MMMIDIAEEEYKIDIRKTLHPNNRPFYTRRRTTNMFACNLFGDRQTGLLSKLKKINKEPKAIGSFNDSSSWSNQCLDLVVRNHITY
jgi:hypothetical protein